jgi:acyl-CoA synthetase (AMP-forming)/AMP-acid ligase II
MEFNLAHVFRAIAQCISDRPGLIYRDRMFTYGEIDGRTDNLARHFVASGLGAIRAPRGELEQWQSGQDHVGVMLFNCNEYLETMLAAFKARLAPFNINYRYTIAELAYLLADASPRALVFHSRFASDVADAIRESGVTVQVLIQVPDDSDASLLTGATWFEDSLTAAPESVSLETETLSGDDLNIIYTGGTTGMPKGVLWRQADAFITSLAGRRKDRSEPTSLAEVADRARAGARAIMPTSPFMHGGGQIPAFQKWHRGGTVVIQSDTVHLDARDVWSTAARHRVGEIMIVGDAFALPLIDELKQNRDHYELSSIDIIFSGGAMLSETNKRAFLSLLPGIRVIDAIGSTESGPIATSMANGQRTAQPGHAKIFRPGKDTAILDEDRRTVLSPSSREIGWLARSGRVALGYLKDPKRTSEAFPSIDGARYLVLGDRARYVSNDEIEFLGREDFVINTGGEKVYSFEVEEVLKSHPAVAEAIVLGRPHPRWGNEVCSIIQLRPLESVKASELAEYCRENLSGYKVPRTFFFEPEMPRTPAGKIDLKWARSTIMGP